MKQSSNRPSRLKKAPTRLTLDEGDVPSFANQQVPLTKGKGKVRQSQKSRNALLAQAQIAQCAREPVAEIVQELTAVNAQTIMSEVLIPYRHNAALEQKLRQWSKAEAFATSFLFLAIVSSAWFWGFGWAFAGAGVICLCMILAALRTLDRPTALVLGKNGLSLRWTRRFNKSSSACIPWRRFFQIASAPDGPTQQTVEFRARPGAFKPAEKLLLRLVYPDFFAGWHHFAFKLKLSGLTSTQDRRQLMAALRSFLPADMIAQGLADILNPIKPESYTQLWLSGFCQAPERTNEQLLLPGESLGNDRYTIVEQMAQGGQGTIYKALKMPSSPCPGEAAEAESACEGPVPSLPGQQANSTAGTIVALKEFVLPSHAGVDVSVRTLENISREASLLQRLDHRHIVRLIDFFVEDHRAYLVLEFVEGPTMKHLVELTGPMNESQVREYALQLSDILSYLHSQSPPVVHRDITPDNLIVGQDGKLKLIDFNVAHQLEGSFTRTIVGKHCYIPPEQFRGRCTPQSDIYATGATLFYLLTGQEPEPISTAHPGAVCAQVSEEMDRIVATATAIDLRHRFEGAAQLLQALQGLGAANDTTMDIFS